MEIKYKTCRLQDISFTINCGLKRIFFSDRLKFIVPAERNLKKKLKKLSQIFASNVASQPKMLKIINLTNYLHIA